jgi:hypothetical protein
LSRTSFQPTRALCLLVLFGPVVAFVRFWCLLFCVFLCVCVCVFNVLVSVCACMRASGLRRCGLSFANLLWFRCALLFSPVCVSSSVVPLNKLLKMFKKYYDVSFSWYKMLREDSERKLLELGVQAGAVSHHAKNWCAVWNFRGNTGAHTAVLVDCGRVALGPKVAPCRSFVFARPCLRSFVHFAF